MAVVPERDVGVACPVRSAKVLALRVMTSTPRARGPQYLRYQSSTVGKAAVVFNSGVTSRGGAVADVPSGFTSNTPR
jgi:hypothetical protein